MKRNQHRRVTLKEYVEEFKFDPPTFEMMEDFISTRAFIATIKLDGKIAVRSGLNKKSAEAATVFKFL